MGRAFSRIFSVGLAGILLACVSAEATAGITVGGGTVRPVGDPSYIYTISIVIDAGDTINAVSGTNPFNPVNVTRDDFITIFGIDGYQGINGVFAGPSLASGGLEQYTAVGRVAGTGYVPPTLTRPNPVTGDADITFYGFHGHDPFTNATSGPIVLGYLIFQSNLPFGVMPTLTLEYEGQIHHGTDLVRTRGTVTLSYSVPEPSSMACLAIGAVAIVGRARARRRPAS